MKVLLIDVNCKYSSTGKIVYSLYQAVNKSGNEAAICYGRGELVEESGIYRFAPKVEVYLHAALTRLTGLTSCFSPIATKRLINFMKEFKPDVVHVHEMHAYFVNLKPVIEYLKANHIRTIWTFHCEFMYTGKCGYAYDCEKWKTGCNHCPRVKEYPSSLGIDQTARMWKEKKKLMENWPELTIVTPSEWLRQRVLQSFCKGSPVLVIHNGVDTSIFYPRDAAELKKKYAPNGEKLVLSVAPDILSDRKGGKWVIKLAEMFHGKPVRFILVGAKRAEVESYPVPDNVTLVERTSNQGELAEYYSMADVFVICSEKENYPTTCIEAEACGTQVCGWDVGGTKETAPKAIECFVKYGDLKSLFCQIENLICATNGINCLKSVEYGEKRMDDLYFALYEGKYPES